MTASATGTSAPRVSLPRDLRELAPLIFAAVAFVILFSRPATLLARDWWNDPDAGHGLLLAPLAVWLGWKRGLVLAQPQRVAGVILLVAGIGLRYLSGLAAELFTMRISMVMAALGVLIFFRGARQAVHWWLPIVLLGLSIPIPAVLTNTLALPLQLKASSWGATLLAARHVPVELSGNIIRLPGRDLFVTEACSGLRSLTALLSLGVLVGGLWLRHPISRVLLILLALPVAMVVNSVRVFLTGFLVFFVDPKLGEGFMHLSEGWLLFVVAFLILGGFTWLVSRAETALLGADDAA
ncbi:MAG: exosortase/archaeosortase family protein [Gemmatimonadales bacterium]